MNVLVSIHSTTTLSGEPERIDLVTTGTLQFSHNRVVLSYEEELSKGELHPAVLTVTGETSALLERSGPMAGTKMMIERGRRCLCHYETGFGFMTVGIFGEAICNQISLQGGILRLSYTMDINARFCGRNEIEFFVRPKESACFS